MIFWVALLISIPLTGYNRLYGFAALAGVFLLLAFFGTVALVTRGQRQADAWLRRVAVHVPFTTPDGVSRILQKVADRITLLLTNRRLLSGAMSWAAANWLLDAASLWVFLWAFGRVVSPVDLLVAYGLANILAVIPITPGGPRDRRGRVDPDAGRVPRAPRGRDGRGAVLAARQLLAADPRRRRLLLLARGAADDARALMARLAQASCSRQLPDALARQALSARLDAAPEHRLATPPALVRAEDPGEACRRRSSLERSRRAGRRALGRDRRGRLDAPVEVALHQVGRSDAGRVEWLRAARARSPKGEDPGVLEELAHHASGTVDVLGELGDPRAQTAQARAPRGRSGRRPRRRVERVDDLGSVSPFTLMSIRAGRARRALLVDSSMIRGRIETGTPGAACSARGG